MSENTNKNLVGHPIFTQVLEVINKNKFRDIAKKRKSERYYKKFNTWTHFVSLKFGIPSRCDSVTEIVKRMIGCVGMQGIGVYLKFQPGVPSPMGTVKGPGVR